MRFAFTVHRRKIRIEGFGINRLITDCLAKGIVLQNVKFISDIEAVMSVSAEDSPKLKKLAKSKYRITVSKGEGFMPFALGLRNEKGRAFRSFIIFHNTVLPKPLCERNKNIRI